MSSGKGGEQSTTVKLPKDIEAAAKDNLELAKKVGSLPYAPYFGGSVAAFTPAQEAAFSGANAASSAFGLPTASSSGLPKASNIGGLSAYTTQPVYEDAMSKVDPAILKLYNSFFYPNTNEFGGSSTKTPAKTTTSRPTYYFDGSGQLVPYSQPQSMAFK